MLISKKYNNYSLLQNNIMKKNNTTLILIFCLIIFFIISMVSVFSARSITSDSMGNIFIKQLIYYVIGVIILLLAYFYKKGIIHYTYLWYISFCFLLLVLLFLGTSINGSKCWLIIGPVSFQPSEFMKIAIVLVIAKILDKCKAKKNLKKEFMMLLKIFVFLLIPSVLTFLEPDTGVVIIYFIIAISMILYRGINKKWYFIVIILFSIIGGSITFLYFFKHDLLLNILGDNIFYRLDRLLNWSSGSGYQLENSLIAIASSGVYGFGFNNTPIYFPEASTDFIFTTFVSNFGFIGSILLFIIIILFDSSIISLLRHKIKKSDQYILVGLFAMTIYQQVQNISMTIGLLPITGITLPFISYGGSSLLSYMFISGIILKISSDSKKFLN